MSTCGAIYLGSTCERETASARHGHHGAHRASRPGGADQRWINPACVVHPEGECEVCDAETVAYLEQLAATGDPPLGSMWRRCMSRGELTAEHVKSEAREALRGMARLGAERRKMDARTAEIVAATEGR